ncbi:hypothetical protein [Actibacterium sp.]|uniref:hypothetical protein n=1 Tax=Actibacterium sp. TaxID=1872125 RepID=UPI003566820A
MKTLSRFPACCQRFASDQSGAVTVDWVVLTAAVVGFGFAASNLVEQGAVALANSITAELSSIEIVIVPPQADSGTIAR